MINHIEYFDVCYDKAEYKKNKKMLNLIYVNKEKRNYKIKIIKKLKRKLKKVGDKNVIFSKEIKNILSENNMFNRESKLIYKENIIPIINNVILQKGNNPNEENIYVLIKSNNMTNNQKILSMISTYKTVNIITPIIKNFIKLEQRLEEESELISVSNNKRKSLLKAEYILNIDFTEEDIAQYSINRKSIIFNVSNNEIAHIRGFDGIIINNIEIDSLKNERFDLQDEYEKNKELIINRIEKSMYKLVGKNGYIARSELLSLQTNLRLDKIAKKV